MTEQDEQITNADGDNEEHEEDHEEEHSFEEEVNDNENCSDLESMDYDKTEHEHKSKIDESYLSLLSLKEKLSNIHVGTNKADSCPSSPNISRRSILHNLPKSLRGSPLLGPSTPSPRVLEEMDKKWQQYLISSKEEKYVTNKGNVKHKLEEQQSQIEELELLLKKASSNKSNAKEFATLFRRGAYSKKVNLHNLTHLQSNTKHEL